MNAQSLNTITVFGVGCTYTVYSLRTCWKPFLLKVAGCVILHFVNYVFHFKLFCMQHPPYTRIHTLSETTMKQSCRKKPYTCHMLTKCSERSQIPNQPTKLFWQWTTKMERLGVDVEYLNFNTRTLISSSSSSPAHLFILSGMTTIGLSAALSRNTKYT